VGKYDKAGQATGDSIIRCMRVACWITKATDTHSEHVILIPFPRQPWLRERALVLRYTYSAPIADVSNAVTRLVLPALGTFSAAMSLS
jgi:hypothetical protein